MGPLPVTAKGNRYIVTLVDYFSKWPEAEPLPNKLAKEVALFLYRMMCTVLMKVLLIFTSFYFIRFGSAEVIITPLAQRERGKVIDRGVEKKFESYFRDRLTFSNIDSSTSRRIYRLALLLRAPETLSSLSKSRISIFNAHLTLLVRKMTSHNLPWNGAPPFAD